MKLTIVFVLSFLSLSISAKSFPTFTKVSQTDANCEIKAILWEIQGTSLGMFEIGENQKRYVGLMKFKSGLRDVFQSAQEVLPTYEARMTVPSDSALPQLKVFYSGRYFQCSMDPVYDSEDTSGQYGEDI